MKRTLTLITALLLASGSAFAADALQGVEKQPLNLHAIGMFLVFVLYFILRGTDIQVNWLWIALSPILMLMMAHKVNKFTAFS